MEPPEAAAVSGISSSEICRRRDEGSLTGVLYGVNKYLFYRHQSGHAIISSEVSQYETHVNRKYQRTQVMTASSLNQRLADKGFRVVVRRGITLDYVTLCS